MNKYEIEIKSLLGGKEKADALVRKMKDKDKGLVERATHKQLNHYFIPTLRSGQVGGNLENLYKNTEKLITDKNERTKFKDIIEKVKKFSVRTRLADKKLFLIVKASIDDTTSENGTARIEFEPEIKKITLDELDELVLKSGFEYQAKWSRERTEYKYKNASVSIDKNAGYGYLAEFERMVEDDALAEQVKTELREMMAELEVAELPQDRLERMFSHYNAHWPEYYGTDKIFTIE